MVGPAFQRCIPTLDRLIGISDHARLLYARRCLMRVLPLFKLAWSGQSASVLGVLETVARCSMSVKQIGFDTAPPITLERAYWPVAKAELRAGHPDNDEADWRRFVLASNVADAAFRLYLLAFPAVAAPHIGTRGRRRVGSFNGDFALFAASATASVASTTLLVAADAWRHWTPDGDRLGVLYRRDFVTIERACARRPLSSCVGVKLPRLWPGRPPRPALLSAAEVAQEVELDTVTLGMLMNSKGANPAADASAFVRVARRRMYRRSS